MAALAIVGAVIAVIGAVKKAQAESNAAKFNANVAEGNAAAARQQGDLAVEAQRRAAARTIGAATAAYGASGGVLTESSASDVLADSARMAKLDELVTRYNYQLKETGYLNEASMYKAQAKNIRTSGYFSAASSAMGGASSAYSYYQMPSSGGSSSSFNDPNAGTYSRFSNPYGYGK